MRRISTMLCLAVCLFVSATASARDIYVNNVTGDDRRSGTTDEISGGDGPFRSIGRALRAAEFGDRVIVAKTKKPYRESISIQAGRHSGGVDRPFRLVSDGAILDGTREVPVRQWVYFGDGAYRYRPRGLTRQILYLEGKPAKRVPVEKGAKPAKLEPLQWCWAGGYIYFRPEKDKTPADYELAHTYFKVGITIYETQYVLISGFVVQGFELDGVNAHDSVFHGELSGMTCRGNARSGISIGGASRVKIRSCLLGNNGEAQLRTEGFSTTELIDCDLLDNTAPRIDKQGGRVIEAKPGDAPKVGAAARDLFRR